MGQETNRQLQDMQKTLDIYLLFYMNTIKSINSQSKYAFFEIYFRLLYLY